MKQETNTSRGTPVARRRAVRMSLVAALVVGVASLAGCSTAPTLSAENMASIIEALKESNAATPDEAILVPPPAVAAALLPAGDDPVGEVPEVEARFDVSVKAAEASNFFMSLVKGTDTNIAVHPEVEGRITLSLRDVTLEEVLRTVRDVYGYRYRRQGDTFVVFPADMRTEVFSIDYLDIVRNGNSRTSVRSGETSRLGADARQPAPRAAEGGDAKRSGASGSEVRTDSRSDFWRDLQDALSLIVGTEDGRKVIVHSQSGVIVVHAMPDELLGVQDYLDTIENVAHRLVVLEAKVIEVTLDDSFQSGVDWSSLLDLGGDSSLRLSRAGSAINPATAPLGGIFAVNADLDDFDGLITLLETQGDVQVLSSPRISTVNNQKAVIKVGQDEYFVTGFDTETELVDGIGTRNIDVDLTPFFSGVALDVLPQIDADNNVILHIHPAISEVMEKPKNITVSTDGGLTIPLALSTIRESDSVVRARSGQVIVVGGLMKNAMRIEESSTPGLGRVPVLGHLFRNRREVMTKSELVILLRPIVVDGDERWGEQVRESTERFGNLRGSDGAGSPATDLTE